MNRIKKTIIPIFLAIICGSICGKLVCDIYTNDVSSKLKDTKIYLIEAGSYNSYDNMVSNTNIGNYIYYEDKEGKYKTIIGLTENYDNIEKITKTYDGETIISEFYSKDKELNKKIKEYDKRIHKIEDINEVKEIVLEMLSLYKDNEENTLIEID